MKKVFLALLILFILLGAVVVAVPVLFKDKLVAMVTSEANKNLNAELTVKDFKISIFRDFPNLTVSLQGYDISGVDRFEGVSLVSGDDLGISVNLFNLLSGDGVEVERIFMENAKVYVYVDSDGNANYDIAKETDEAEDEDVSESADEEELRISLKGWEINNAQLIYDDKSMEVFTEVKGLQHTGSGDFSLTQFILSTQTSASSLTVDYEGISYLSKTKLDLAADLDIDLDRMFFGFRQNKLTLNDLDLTFNGDIEMPADDIKMNLTAGSAQSSLKNLLSLVPGVFLEGYESVKADGEFALDAKVIGTYNDRTYPSFDIKLDVKNGKVQYPDLPASIDRIALKSKVSSAGGADLDNVIIDLSNFHADIASNPIDLSLYVTQPISDPNIDAKLYTKMDLAAIAKAVPMQGYDYSGFLDANVVMKGKMSSIEMERYEDFNASGNAAARKIKLDGDSLPMPLTLDTAYLAFAPKFITLNTLVATVEDATLRADGAVSNYLAYVFKDEELKGTLNLESDYLNVNSFMTEEEGPIMSETEASTETEETDFGYIEVPKNIDFTLSSSIEEMLYEDMVINDFRGVVRVKNQTLSFDNVGLKALGGDLIMNGYYATNTGSPEVNMDFKVEGLDINITATTFNTVAKLAPIAKSATGKFNAQFAIKGNLDQNMEPEWASFGGEGLVATKDVFFENFEPINRLASKLSMDRFAKQNIKDALINFEIKEGKVMIKPVETKIGDIPARIAGYTSIDQQIDYTFNLKIPTARLGNSAASAIAGLSEKLGGSVDNKVIDLDVFMTNTVSDPKIRTNLSGAVENLKDQVVDRAKEEINKKKKELEDKALEAKRKAEEEAKAKVEEAKRKLEEEKEKARQAAEAEKKRLEEEARKKAEEEKRKLEEEAKERAKKLFGKP